MRCSTQTVHQRIGGLFPDYASEQGYLMMDRAAFVRLFDETVASLRFPFALAEERAELSLEKVLTKLYAPDRAMRAAAAAALTKGLQANVRLLAYILNNLVLEHRSTSENALPETTFLDRARTYRYGDSSLTVYRPAGGPGR